MSTISLSASVSARTGSDSALFLVAERARPHATPATCSRMHCRMRRTLRAGKGKASHVARTSNRGDVSLFVPDRPARQDRTVRTAVKTVQDRGWSARAPHIRCLLRIARQTLVDIALSGAFLRQCALGARPPFPTLHCLFFLVTRQIVVLGSAAPLRQPRPKDSCPNRKGSGARRTARDVTPIRPSVPPQRGVFDPCGGSTAGTYAPIPLARVDVQVSLDIQNSLAAWEW